ncbi:hypothetical protein [Leuconostoc falkenbergense]|uniref:hypothetical protein n=1 Tax=Leuconostoc falkenbergense TaxID=2766470 RepID=UPI0024A95B3B|nr:hypothetical protein [Leuconostoc falkenbergense]MDI6553503.1 hypothetical protein [Leuconostoc falkenbergense]
MTDKHYQTLDNSNDRINDVLLRSNVCLDVTDIVCSLNDAFAVKDRDDRDMYLNTTVWSLRGRYTLEKTAFGLPFLYFVD